MKNNIYAEDTRALCFSSVRLMSVTKTLLYIRISSIFFLCLQDWSLPYKQQKRNKAFFSSSIPYSISTIHGMLRGIHWVLSFFFNVNAIWTWGRQLSTMYIGNPMGTIQIFNSCWWLTSVHYMCTNCWVYLKHMLNEHKPVKVIYLNNTDLTQALII